VSRPLVLALPLLLPSHPKISNPSSYVQAKALGAHHHIPLDLPLPYGSDQATLEADRASVPACLPSVSVLQNISLEVH